MVRFVTTPATIVVSRCKPHHPDQKRISRHLAVFLPVACRAARDSRHDSCVFHRGELDLRTSRFAFLLPQPSPLSQLERLPCSSFTAEVAPLETSGQFSPRRARRHTRYIYVTYTRLYAAEQVASEEGTDHRRGTRRRRATGGNDAGGEFPRRRHARAGGRQLFN